MADSRETRARAAETKFLVEPALAADIRRWARAHLDPDPHGTGPFSDEYLTTSLYFDTAHFDVLSRRGSYGRAKYRIRRYSTSDVVFLERKLRRPRIVAKRRTRIGIDELAHLNDADDNGSAWAGAWFLRRLRARGLGPVCQVSYSRTARGMIDDGGPARLTLDESIRACAIDGPRFSADPGVLISEPRLILELKYRGYLPAVFKQLIEEFQLSPEPASKYRYGMAALGREVTAVESEAEGSPATDVHV